MNGLGMGKDNGIGYEFPDGRKTMRKDRTEGGVTAHGQFRLFNS